MVILKVTSFLDGHKIDGHKRDFFNDDVAHKITIEHVIDYY
jgi:hypothetical protein